VLAIPAGRWLERRPVDRAVFWTSIYYRLFYLLWIPLPWLFGNQGQIWAMITIAFLMGIPVTALGVGFNTLFASAVPSEWRASVIGVRNVVLSVTFMLSSLGSGYLLDHMRFPGGYQVVFAIGAFGALMSSLHLYFIKVRPQAGAAAPAPAASGTSLPAPRGWRATLRLDIWKTPFATVLLVMLGFHLAQFLVIPIIPLYFVNEMGLSDTQIGIGTAIFYLIHMLGSTQLARLSHKLGHQRLTAFGAMAMSIYPIVITFSRSPYLYFGMQMVSGLVWSMVGGAQANYLLERIPEHDRPSHLAWYTVIANACILAGSLAGPAIASATGLAPALILFGGLRLVAGYAILRWGKTKDG
jgi:MFS family permease